MSGCENIQSWFEAEFNRRYRDAKAGCDDAMVVILDRCRSKTMTGIDNLQAWSRGVLMGKIPGDHGGGDFRVAIFETIDWVAFQSKLEVLDDDDEDEEKKCSDCGKFNKEGSYSEDDEECKNWICEDCYGLYCGCHGKKGCEEDEEEEEEETCASCGETKTDIWYYNTTPVKNAPVCTDCRNERDELETKVREKQKEIETALRAIKLAHDDKEQKCDCCEITYPGSRIDYEGGKYMCKSCQEECPCYDSECGSVCPAVNQIVDALATNSSASAQPTVKVRPIVTVNFRRAMEMEDLYNAEQKRKEEMRKSGVPI